MKNSIKYIVILTMVLMNNLVIAQGNKTTLNVDEFAATMDKHPEFVVLDVRTPNEYDSGHISESINYNWKSENFKNQISNLDKSKEVLVYCLSGRRSAAAAASMREAGFTAVYELEGGIINWRSKNQPEIVSKKSNPGMTKQDFDALLNSDKLVLVDFYADWCAPCLKMEPYLKEIAIDMKATVEVVRIDADKNKELCKVLGVDALPVLQLYKSKSLIWEHSGFIEKKAVVKQLE